MNKDPIISQSHSRFTSHNDGFQCVFCSAVVPPRKKSCRNHCPYCLHSLHVDINPGDRANECRGLLQPVSYELSSKKGLVLVFQCLSCHKKTKNIAAVEDEIAADDYEAILRLTQPSKPAP